jgi:hypothetical protein
MLARAQGAVRGLALIAYDCMAMLDLMLVGETLQPLLTHPRAYLVHFGKHASSSEFLVGDCG